MDSGRRELESSLENLERLSNEDHDKLKKKVYETFSGISFLIIEAKNRDFKKGWASQLVDRHNEKMFEREEGRILEDAANKYVKPMFYSQKGGAPVLKESATMSVIKSASKIDPEQLSIDKTFWKIKDMIGSIDSKVKMYARELGPFRFFYDRDIDFKIPFIIPTANPPYFMKFDIPIPPRSIPVIISIIVETIRIIFSVGPLSNDIARKVLSLVVGLIDILKGDWKQGILSIIGFYGQVPLLAGLIGKVFLNMLDLIAPDLQERIVLDLYQSGKSMCIGFLLWGFANFAPDFARAIARAQFDAIKKIVTDTNGKIDQIEASMQKSIEPAGLKLKLNDIPEDFVPTFDDIQNLQAIVRQPSIYCSKEFQDAIEPLRKIPPMRLVLELMSIPTDPQTLAFECRDQAGESLEDTLGDSIKPKFVPIPGSPLAEAIDATDENSKAKEPKAEESKDKEPKAEEPKAEEPKAEEPKDKEPKAEEPKPLKNSKKGTTRNTKAKKTNTRRKWKA